MEMGSLLFRFGEPSGCFFFIAVGVWETMVAVCDVDFTVKKNKKIFQRMFCFTVAIFEILYIRNTACPTPNVTPYRQHAKRNG